MYTYIVEFMTFAYLDIKQCPSVHHPCQHTFGIIDRY